MEQLYYILHIQFFKFLRFDNLEKKKNNKNNISQNNLLELNIRIKEQNIRTKC